MGTRLSVDLGQPVLMKLLKLEAQETDTSIKEVLVRALEAYFAHRLETRSLMRAADSVFDEWNDPRDSDYDKL